MSREPARWARWREVPATLLPPVGDARFWLTQALVLAVTAAHVVAHVVIGGVAEVLVVAAYAFPVVYAALEFGFRGSMATTGLVVVLTLPYVVDDALTGARSDFAGHLTELVVLLVIAPVVGVVVERERAARIAHEAAETRYRALFAASGVPALVLDEAGRIQEANPAAETVLGARTIAGTPLGDVLGDDAATAILAGGEPTRLRLSKGVDVRIVASAVESDGGGRLTQVLFQDVTEETAGNRRTRTFALAVLVAQEEERRRIAQELHDEALQLVVELRRRVERAARHAGEEAGELREARALADEVIDELRTVALRLRPAELDDLGLAASLERLVAEARRRGAPAELVVAGRPADPPPAAGLALYRVAQEALTNAEHHARAGAIVLRLGTTGGSLCLEAGDDGVGFDADRLAESERGGHLGVLGMRERLELVGGRLRIESAPGKGTRVTAEVPLPADGAPEPGSGEPGSRGHPSDPADRETRQPSGGRR